MSPKKTYTAIYERDEHDDAWNVRIDGLEGCQTYGRSLRQARRVSAKRSHAGSTEIPRASRSETSSPETSPKSPAE